MKVGIVGGGQLGQMLALAGYPLGLRFRFIDPVSPNCASGLGEFIHADFDDSESILEFAEGLDVITFEFENISTAFLEELTQRLPVFPPVKALSTSQDRYEEKRFFEALGIPTAPFRVVNNTADLRSAVKELGLPAILKTRRFGYDGKGQIVLRSNADLDSAVAQLGGKDLILEGFIAFDRELSLIAVRGRNGDVVFYPVVENRHHEGILDLSLAPAPGLSETLQERAEAIGKQALNALDYVGVLVVELFQRGDELIVNEMAPRVHNSGHWSIEGATTSQFANHLRAVAGLPLGSTAVHGFVAMINLVGELPDTEAVLAMPGAHLHLYGKVPRPGRKLGHVTICAESREGLRQSLHALERACGRKPSPL